MEAGQQALDAAEPSVASRLVRIAAWAGGTALVIFVLDQLGVPVSDWIRELFRKVAEVPAWAVLSGVVLQTMKTSFAALAWLGILRAAFPRARVSYRFVLAAYATGVALNTFLPANLGTLVMLIMFTSIIAGATFAAVVSGMVVQSIPYSVFNSTLYLYLFLSVSGSFSIKLGFVSDHQALILFFLAGAVVLVALLVRIFWRRAEKLRAQLATGGAILRTPRKALVAVVLPEFASYLARLGIVAVFLGAYGIPVTFHNVASVNASNSISNSVSFTPGGVGVTQAMNTAALRNSTSKADATAYSVSQQLITSAWNVVFAMVLVSWVFGWSGGKELVETSYGEARVKSREMKEQKEQRKARKRASKAGPS